MKNAKVRYHRLIWLFLIAQWMIPRAHASVIFEGYYKLYSLGQHIGYTIQKYILQTDGSLQSLSFTKTSSAGGNIQESIVTFSKPDLTPISLKYTALIEGKPFTIDAELKNETWKGIIFDKGKKRTVQSNYEKGVFFSSILIYALLKSPQGLRVGQKFSYKAIAEENLETVAATAIVEQETLFRSKIPVFKIINDFKGHKFISFVTVKGEVLYTEAPHLQIASELVAESRIATEGQVVPLSVIRNIFGEIPKGENNFAWQAHQKGEWPNQEPVPAKEFNKKEGVPPGKGIRVKGK